MTREYPLYQQSARPSQPTDKATSQLWRPLTNGWGILGAIIFFGLVLRLIEDVSHWRTQRPVSFPSEHATPVAGQSSPRSR
jgi:hypothetical protein